MNVGRCIPIANGPSYSGGGGGGVGGAATARIVVGVGLDSAEVLTGLDAILQKLREIEAQAERTAAALAKLK